jgi:hypothetical protein
MASHQILKRKSGVFSLFLLFVFQLVTAHNCFAELHGYTDSDGVIHFTDDLSKVPTKMREHRKRPSEPPLTPKESNMLKALMQLDRIKNHDVSVKNMGELKKSLNDFAEYSKNELGDPGEQRDPRLSTPEGALNLFKSGLINGNLNDIKASVIGKYWESFSRETKTESRLRQMAKLISDKVVTKIRDSNFATIEFIATKNGKESSYGEIELINFYGNWKIEKF